MPNTNRIEHSLNANQNDANRQLQGSLKTLFDAEIIGIIRAGFSGEILDANDAFLKMLGYSRAELAAGKLRWVDITPPEWTPVDNRVIATLQSVGKAEPFEKEYLHKNGSRVPVLLGVALEHDSRDVCISYVLDLTERKRIEAAHRETEERYRALTDAMPQLVWATDKDGSHFYYNQQWYDFTGLSVEESMGFGFTNALHPEDKERTLKRWEQAWRAGQGYEIEYRFYSRPQGEYRWFLGRATPVRDAKGIVTQWVGTCTDINEQKRLAAELARANQERERMFDEVSTPIVPVFDGIVAMPLIGSLDAHRMQQATNAALEYVRATNAHSVILDITGARLIDSHAIANLTNLVSALKLVGTEAIVTGVTAQAARSFVYLGVDLTQLKTRRTLAEALSSIIKQQTQPLLERVSASSIQESITRK